MNIIHEGCPGKRDINGVEFKPSEYVVRLKKNTMTEWRCDGCGERLLVVEENRDSS